MKVLKVIFVGLIVSFVIYRFIILAPEVIAFILGMPMAISIFKKELDKLFNKTPPI